jgi:hypothetical protein
MQSDTYLCLNVPGYVSSMLQDYRIQKTLKVLLGVDIMTPEAAAQEARKQQEQKHPAPGAATSQAKEETSKEAKPLNPDDPISKVCM